MVDPVVYYVPSAPAVGEIVAIAPAPLRESDRDPKWTEMRITEAEWKMLMGKEIHTNWFVAMDTDGMHQLKTRVTANAPTGTSNLNSLFEVVHDIMSPELIIKQDQRGIYIHDPIQKPIQGRIDFWITHEQNQNRVIAHKLIDVADFAIAPDIYLFAIPEERSTIYFSGRIQRVQDARFS